jgi:hypothetical protein
MKGTIISIVIGALLGVALTLGSSVHASRAAANRAALVSGGIITPAQTAADPVPHPADRAPPPDDQAPFAK